MYPALAAAEALTRIQPAIKLHFVGSGGLEREIVRESDVSFQTCDDVSGGPVAGVNMIRKAVSAARLAAGAVQALGLLRRYRPGAVLLTGGWSSLPVALAARVQRVPVLIFLPDIEPGSSIRLLRRFARRVALTVPESTAYFQPGQTVVTGYPLRQAVVESTRAAAQAHFGLDAGRTTLLVFGGSRGARSLNRALLASAAGLLADGVQIIHVTGKLDWHEVETQRTALAAQTDCSRYHIFPYLHQDMGLALAAADLVISRAGASVLAEFPLFGLAAILVPYPHAWRYQKVNADYLAERGAAVVLADERLEADLLTTVRGLLADPVRLAAMRRSAAALAQPDGAARLASELIHLAEEAR